MEILTVSFNEYAKLIPVPYHIFGSAAFSNINQDKCESLHYLLFKDSKYRLGLVAGILNNTLFSPFSAPFGGFSFLQEDIRINSIDEALSLLLEWAGLRQVHSVKLTLPPLVYHESFLSKQFNSLYRAGFEIKKTDLNYVYHLDNFSADYPASIWYNARKNLKIGLSNNFSFRLCNTTDEKYAAYNVIRQNRETKGFPLRMTWEQVQLSAAVIPADFFLSENNEGAAVAAAVVFHVAKGIVQVIYWGDLPDYAHLKTMNFLSYRIFEYYHHLNLKMIDIGPSTENSIPNYGLCEFKESIGCSISCKFSFSKNLY
jgi:hypothetical protein